MKTTLMIKTNKKLRDEAKSAAAELGVPLTTVLNALLRQFVREQRFSVSAEFSPTKEKLALWKNISIGIDKGKDVKTFNNVEDLIKDLRLV